MKLIKKQEKIIPYDKNEKKPIIRASICNGEKVAGFKNLKTGKFEEVMLIKTDHDLDTFMELYDISVAEIATEW